MTSFFTPAYEQLDPTLYGYEEVDDILVPKIGRNPTLEEFDIKFNYTKCAAVRCPCRIKLFHCCSFYKFRIDLNTSECKIPLGYDNF